MQRLVSWLQSFAFQLRISASSVTQLTDRLIRNGLIERQGVTGDRRLVMIALSAEGKRLVDRFRKRRSLMFTKAIAQPRQAEQKDIIEAMKMVVRVFESSDQAAVQTSGLAPKQGRTRSNFTRGDKNEND